MAKLMICILSLFEVISIKGEATTSSYYRAAVVEHPPTIKHSNAVQNLRETIDQYGFFIEKAHSQKADIIVFPEAGLFGKNFLIFHVLPKKQEDYTPDEHIGRLSTFARNFSMYVAVTVLERYTHSNNKTRMYITAVIFNRRGVIVCCYRKFHLFGERVDVTNDVSPTYFDTDFGVRFGLLIGLDILFKHPASALMKEKNVTDFIYTTKWSSELPFSTAVQAQWMWSVGNDVNLIAAGLNCMELGSSGSGIYRGKSFPVSRLHVLNNMDGWTMIVGNVTKHNKVGQNYDVDNEYVYTIKRITGTKPLRLVRQKELAIMRSENINLPFRETKSENPVETNFNRRICHKSLCCSFNFTMNFRRGGMGFWYKTVVYDGFLTSVEGKAKIVLGVQLCGIVLCSNDSISSCGSIDGFPQQASRMPAVNFSSILITGNFTKGNSNVYPNVLLWPSVSKTSNMTDFLMDPRQVKFAKDVNNESILSIDVSIEIISCSVFSRVFSRDSYISGYEDAIEVIQVIEMGFPYLGILLTIIFYLSVFYMFFISSVHWHVCKIFHN